MRHYMVCPQNEEMLHKIPPHVRDAISKEAVAEALLLWQADEAEIQRTTFQDGYAEGQRDMLARCIAAVDSIGNKTATWRVSDQPHEDYFAAVVDSVSAMRALLEGKK